MPFVGNFADTQICKEENIHGITHSLDIFFNILVCFCLAFFYVHIAYTLKLYYLYSSGIC